MYMNGPSPSLEQVESVSPKISRSFFHEWITFDEKKYEIRFSPEARESLQTLVSELQTEFVEQPEEDINNTDTLSLNTAVQVIELMETAGKWNKAISKFRHKLAIVLRWLWKKKEIKKATEKIEKKIKKYAKHPRIEVHIEYESTDWRRSIEWLHMTVWPESTADRMIDWFNKFLGFQRLINERKK